MQRLVTITQQRKYGIREFIVFLIAVYKAKLAEKTTKEKQSAVKDVLCKAVRVATNVLQNEVSIW